MSVWDLFAAEKPYRYGDKPVYGARFRPKRKYTNVTCLPVGVHCTASRRVAVAACVTADCLDTVDYDYAKLKPKDHIARICLTCRTVAGGVISSKWLYEARHLIDKCHVIEGKGTCRWWLFCCHDRCGVSMLSHTWRKRKGMCLRHAADSCIINGKHTRSLIARKFQNTIVDIDTRKVAGYARYAVHCTGPGCGVLIWKWGTALKTSQKCRKCAARSRRKPADEQLYRQLCARARSKAIPVGLSIDQFRALLAIANCFYCNRKVSRNLLLRKARTGPSSRAYGIDRLDNSGGYTYINCVSCCTACNRIKNAYMSASGMLTYSGSAALIAAHRVSASEITRLADQHRRASPVAQPPPSL